MRTYEAECIPAPSRLPHYGPVWRSGILLITTGFWPANGAPVTLPVVVFDHASVRPEILAPAEVYFASVLGRAGIDVQWVNPDQGRRDVRVDASAVVIYLLPREQTTRFKIRTRGCLGVALVSSGIGRPVYWAVIFYDEIRAISQGRNADFGVILGHVMIHEVGHLLLGEAHSVSGIMKPGWSAEEFYRIKQGLAEFTREESRQMRSKLQARHKTVQTQDPE